MKFSILLIIFQVLAVSICLTGILGQEEDSRDLHFRGGYHGYRNYYNGGFKLPKRFSYLDACPDAFVDLSTSCTTPSCGLKGNATGIIVCRDHPYYNNYNMSICIDPTRGLDDDVCGLCAGDPQPVSCPCTCDLTNPETGEDIIGGGVVIRRLSGFFMRTGFVSPEDSITFQLESRYGCLEEPC